MAEFRVSLGAVADIASSQELDSGITGLQGHIDKRFREHSAGSPKPIRRKLIASGATATTIGSQSVSAVIFGDTPAIERFWVIRSYAIFNATTPLTAEYATAIGFLCVGNAAQPSSVDLVGQTFTGIPAANTFNSSSIRVNTGMNVYLVINTAVTDDVAAIVEIDEYLDYTYNAQRI